ncbi:unnamed protein product [Arctogadus glacialis]
MAETQGILLDKAVFGQALGAWRLSPAGPEAATRMEMLLRTSSDCPSCCSILFCPPISFQACRPSSPLCPVNVLHLSSPEHASVQFIADSPGESHPSSSDLRDQQLTLLWRKRSTEVVVAVLPSQIKGRSIFVHHSELRSLRPHPWLTGEIIHGLMHLSAYTHNVVDTIYLMDHYTAGVILFGDRATVRRQSLPKNIHAKSGTVFQLDPSPASSELEDYTCRPENTGILQDEENMPWEN